MSMDPDDDSEVEYDFPPYIRQYKSGRVERYGSAAAADAVPAGTDPAGTGVSSTDVVINRASGLWARIYLPAAAAGGRRQQGQDDKDDKLPVVVYYHGGAFVAGSTAQRATHLYLTALAAGARALVVSPEYRLAPEHPLPTAFEDSWEALRWVASHAQAEAGDGSADADAETPCPRGGSWVADHGDLSRLFIAGASAGATIAHNMAVRAGGSGSGCGGLSIAVEGLLVVHPFFAGESRISAAEPEDRARAGAFWRYRCPGTPGLDDPLCNPFSSLGGGGAAPAARRVLVCVAEKDQLRDRGVWYYEGLSSRAGGEKVALHESMGVGHVFHLADPGCDQARALHERVLAFLRSGA